MAWCEVGDCFEGFVGDAERDEHMGAVHGRGRGREAEPGDAWAWKCVVGGCEKEPKAFAYAPLLFEHHVCELFVCA